MLILDLIYDIRKERAQGVVVLTNSTVDEFIFKRVDSKHK